MAEAMTWAFQLLAFFEKGLGSETVLQRLQEFASNRQFTTMFSGMDCARQAWDMISTAVLETHGTMLENKAVFMVEINKQARSFLKANFVPNPPSPAPCLFGDIMEWVVKKPRGKWTAKNITLSNTARCFVHGKECSTIRGTMDCSGPPCVLFSQLGKMEGEKNETEFRKHVVYMAHLVRMKHPMCIHENVRGFPEEALARELTDYTIHAATYDARQFGFPMSRTRVYRILTGPRARWRKEAPSFQEIADAALADLETNRPKMTADDLFTEGVGAQNEFFFKLTPWQRDNLEAYRRKFPNEHVYDLASSCCRDRGKTSLKDGTLMCITTNSARLWNDKYHRWLSANELLGAVGVPSSEALATAARVPPVVMTGVSEAARVTLSGNSMHVPSVGFALLCAALFVEPV